MSFFERVRQWRYPKEFRILPSIWPSELIVEFEKLTEAMKLRVSSDLNGTPIDLTRTQQNFFSDMGTGLWRLRQKMVQPGTNQPLEEMRRAYRHLESTWDALIQGGIEIQDHTGELFDSGLSLKAIAFQPTAGIKREKVIETIKPSIYFKNQLIQMGEVIVATPEKPVNDVH